MAEKNWAGNFRYNAAELHLPDSEEQVQELAARSDKVKVLGTRHSFNAIADTTGSLISLEKLNRVIGLDETNRRVTVEGGIRYGELGQYLNERGYALHNMASLPHISAAGAVATATHGSGDRNRNLAAAVHALEIVKSDGEKIAFSRDVDADRLAGAVVGLGALGIVTRLTLDVVPAFQAAQVVYENLPLDALDDHLDDIFSSGYSVSLFTDWQQSRFNQVWVKKKADGGTARFEPELFGAQPADSGRHPVPGMPADNCSEQLGVVGPWHERLPHFRMEFMPSAGDELQSEYFVRRQDAVEALRRIDRIKENIAPHLYISEVRTIAADDLWMSPCYNEDSVGIHFTWKADWASVRHVLPLIEEQLEPLNARPHWGKLFTMPPERLRPLFGRLADFRRLVEECDPQGKFRNEFLERYIV